VTFLGAGEFPTEQIADLDLGCGGGARLGIDCEFFLETHDLVAGAEQLIMLETLRFHRFSRLAYFLSEMRT